MHPQVPQFSNIQVQECLVRVRRSEGDNLALQELADVEQEGETQQWADVAHLGTVDIVFVCEADLQILMLRVHALVALLNE